MDQQTETVPANGKTQPRGRKSQEGQEAVIKLSALKGSISELVSLHIKKQKAAETLSAAIKAVAEKSGLLSVVVAKFVKARAGEKFEEEKTKVEQLSMVFEELGEVKIGNE